MPKSNVDFWQNKFEKNRQRDIKVRNQLDQLGWKSLDLWECQLKSDFGQTLDELELLLAVK